MKTNRILIVVTIALVLVNLVMAYFLWNNKRGRGHERERKQERGDWMVKELNLDDNQKEEHKKIRDAHFNSMKPVFDSITQARRNLYSQINAGEVNDSVITVYSEQIGNYHAQVTRLTFDHFRQMRSILRPEQQQKLDTLMQRIVSDMGKRKSREQRTENR